MAAFLGIAAIAARSVMAKAVAARMVAAMALAAVAISAVAIQAVAIQAQALPDGGHAPVPAPVDPPAFSPEGAWAFVDVTVLPMDRERVLEGQTVVVRDGVIVALGTTGSVDVPDDATRIDGEGRYLLPGLAEMHAHVPPVPPGSDAWPDREALEDIMFLYVANGVTTIRGMLGSSYQLALREELERGEMLGPTFFVGAPSINGNSAPDPEAAEAMIRRHHDGGYDLQKIHPGVSLPTWERMDAVADEVGFTYGGHVPQAVGLERALASGMSTVDHLDGYVFAAASEPIRRRLEAGENVPLGEVVASATDERILELVRMTRDAGTWNVPTMYLWENLYGATDAEEILAGPEMAYVSPQQRQAWRQQAAGRPALPPEVVVAHDDLRRRILEALADGGAGILMGTDSPQMFNVPGFALHREIMVMSAAGLTNWQVLESGTRSVARYAAEELERDGNFGTVEVGHRADLVLLEENPLEDLSNLTARAGVMVRGRWVPASEIRAGLERLARKHGG